MIDRQPLNKWVDYATDAGVLVIAIKLADEADFFEKPEDMTKAILDLYKHESELQNNPSCIAVIETPVATSLLIRILYRLFRECQKHRGDLYVCSFPREYMISLSTLGLTELPGFHLKPTEEAAVEEIRRRTLPA